jgi:hypothetical protein
VRPNSEKGERPREEPRLPGEVVLMFRIVVPETQSSPPLAPAGRAPRRLRLPGSLRLVLVVPPLLAGCAGPNQVARSATRAAFSALEGGEGVDALTRLDQQPVVIHVEAGQVIPLDLAIESGVFELDVPPLELRARKSFYLMLRADGPPLLSEDGIEFEERPRNSFLLGFKLRKGEQPRLQVGLSVRPDASPSAD